MKNSYTEDEEEEQEISDQQAKTMFLKNPLWIEEKAFLPTQVERC
jgi:hypothetical protein